VSDRRPTLLSLAIANTRRPDPTRRRLAALDDGMRTCTRETCGIRFTPTREWQVFCSDTCRGKAWRRAHRRPRGAG
jgi:hypothetical protein